MRGSDFPGSTTWKLQRDMDTYLQHIYIVSQYRPVWIIETSNVVVPVDTYCNVHHFQV